ISFLLEEVQFEKLAGYGVGPKVVGNAAFRVHEPSRALSHRHFEYRAPYAATFGDDLDDAVRCLGSVERRRGRSFDYFNAFDVLGGKVPESRYYPTPEPLCRRAR